VTCPSIRGTACDCFRLPRKDDYVAGLRRSVAAMRRAALANDGGAGERRRRWRTTAALANDGGPGERRRRWRTTAALANDGGPGERRTTAARRTAAALACERRPWPASGGPGERRRPWRAAAALASAEIEIATTIGGSDPSPNFRQDPRDPADPSGPQREPITSKFLRGLQSVND